jgi:iron-sulfur cluster assembly accessory protein
MTLNQAGCEVKITEQAAKEFTSMCEDENKLLESSYLRVGANSGGCSGWKYSLDFEDSIDSEDLTFEQYDVTLVVDKTILNDVIGDVEVDYKQGNLIEQGFIFKRLKYGHVCGCGESFTPIKDIPSDGIQKLGWN